jgi:carbon monoxide dehydrogenase subunit G
MLLEETITIATRADDVFAYLAKHENHAEFIEANVSCEQTSSGPMGVGTTLKNEARIVGRSMIEHFEVVRFEPGRVIEKASRGGSSFETTDRFELEPRGDATVVRFVVTGRARNVLERLLFVVLKPILRGSMRKALRRLKDILEGRRENR